MQSSGDPRPKRRYAVDLRSQAPSSRGIRRCCRCDPDFNSIPSVAFKAMVRRLEPGYLPRPRYFPGGVQASTPLQSRVLGARLIPRLAPPSGTERQKNRAPLQWRCLMARAGLKWRDFVFFYGDWEELFLSPEEMTTSCREVRIRTRVVYGFEPGSCTDSNPGRVRIRTRVVSAQRQASPPTRPRVAGCLATCTVTGPLAPSQNSTMLPA